MNLIYLDYAEYRNHNKKLAIPFKIQIKPYL